LIKHIEHRASLEGQVNTMLSAIAARKAAQAAKQLAEPLSAANTASSASTNTPPRSSSEEQEGQPGPTSSKRKPSTSQISSPGSNKKRKKKEVVRVDNVRQRYFHQEEENVVLTDDSDHVIIIDSNQTQEGEGSDSSSSGSEGSDAEVTKGVGTLPSRVEPKASEKRSRARAWSPSQVVADSDSERSDVGEGPSAVLDLSTPVPSTRNFRHRARAGLDNTRHIATTTFTPRIGTNVFKVDVDADGIVAGLAKEGQSTNEVQSPSGTGTIVVLEPGETLALVGTYSLTVQKGAIKIAGTALYPSSRPHHIFAIKCSPIPILTALSQPTSTSDVPSRPTSRLSERIPSLANVNASNSVVLIRPLHTGVEGLGKVCRTFAGVFDVDSKGLDDCLGIPTCRVAHTLHSPALIPFSLPPSWQDALSSPLIPDIHHLSEPTPFTPSSHPLVALVRGPKRTGKSTFARTLLNRLVSSFTRVAYLECDVGQTEFTPPGMVALHVIDRPVFGGYSACFSSISHII
jgi:polynucleotide 5'-hydroxyl-kinase GRC3/NOL9